MKIDTLVYNAYADRLMDTAEDVLDALCDAEETLAMVIDSKDYEDAVHTADDYFRRWEKRI